MSVGPNAELLVGSLSELRRESRPGCDLSGSEVSTAYHDKMHKFTVYHDNMHRFISYHVNMHMFTVCHDNMHRFIACHVNMRMFTV
jgi:hypothetical protein